MSNILAAQPNYDASACLASRKRRRLIIHTTYYTSITPRVDTEMRRKLLR